jgi:hypothetical protein
MEGQLLLRSEPLNMSTPFGIENSTHVRQELNVPDTNQMDTLPFRGGHDRLSRFGPAAITRAASTNHPAAAL